MRILWVLIGVLAGLVIGAVLGFGAALVAMSFSKQKSDGTYGMMEVIVCVPTGAIIGFVLGAAWGLTTTISSS